ncbi:SAM-dependent methyltransferase [Pedobacter sp. HMWF019]|uniref:class I SAM-dependent methyltransferase n=1 Tax=Pedobacter sp. HMWF019 TaxID=2056856 RepID=UPI000D39856D|nr:SAM-dependent methyltransferase [Pedobacter sp. HMWF019]PTS94424.1 SAM-dependent methyltransferase [Pedobacter sp. HMWF019]
MSNQLHLDQFRVQLQDSLLSGVFVKVSLGNYQGNEKELKNIYVRRVKIKRNDMLSFTYRYKTRDIFKNYPLEEGIQMIVQLISNDFKICTLFTTLKELILEHNRKGEIAVRETLIKGAGVPDLAHNKEKKRLIKPAVERNYLHDLNITDEQGEVFKNAQDKYKQINQYIELLSPMIKELPAGSLKKVADMGSGKGYLTFALYDYLQNVLKLDVQVTGVEYREDLVKLCNRIAVKSGFTGLNFAEGSIQDFDASSTDLLIALHACDTATDDAIFKGIKAGSKLIVVAPCCHKQIRKEIVKGKKRNELDFLTRHGIFLERQAEMVTDAMRALILEYFGYKTKVMQFISDAHTPKNVLVVGVKTKDNPGNRKEVLEKIRETKVYFGIGYHHLERLLGLDA